MNYVKLGTTGLDVSRICLGCMGFGEQSASHTWSIDEASSRPLLKRALEAGVNFFDTANAYSGGSSEEIVGRALRDFAKRDDAVLATKVYFPLGSGPNSGGLSRKAIMTQVDASLVRLGVSYIDLYQIHRWDNSTPIDETLEALHDIIKAGKARYVGASSMFAWQFSKALYTAELRGWSKFVSMQNHYNLLNREEEREMLPLCADQGIGVIPWSPLARGRLTRDWDTATERTSRDNGVNTLYDSAPGDRTIVERVAKIATQREVSRAQIALAWMLSKPVVTAPVVGATRMLHLDEAIAALDLQLTDEEIAQLEEPYVPHPVKGF
ncbi:MAG: aryl-alcohol dehydrogenase-like predicted oxidoreductase [Gammaproteobacteria bacterium]|jgi:aryl-alcohol dehydrogenase-like predicted oxidoreductase